MRPVRQQPKKSLGSNHNIMGIKKAAKKQEAIHQPEVNVVNEESDDEAKNIPEYARLTQAELNLSVNRNLVTVNPQAPPNKIMYDYLERKNKINDSIDQMVMHVSFEGDYIHTSHNEYKIQEEI
jgi:hypothetical protein